MSLSKDQYPSEDEVKSFRALIKLRIASGELDAADADAELRRLIGSQKDRD